MTTFQRVLSIPFSLLRPRARQSERKTPDRKARKTQFRIAAQPQESKRFRLERECARYRSIHFPR